MNKESQIFIDYLAIQNIKLDNNEFDFQIETHPDFPSLLAFHDALNFFKVPNIAVQIEDKDVTDLPQYFIAQVQGPSGSELAMVEKKEQEMHVTFAEEKKIIYSIEKFQYFWSGVVLVAENDDRLIQRKAQKDVGFVALSILGTVLMLFVSIPLAIFSILIFAGIFFAKEAVSQELSINTNFSSKFCNISAQSDCTSVIQSDSFKLFGTIGLSDFSILYFTGQLVAYWALILYQAEAYFFTYTLVGTFAIIPISIASIYYQWRVAKKWCIVCLAIISVLYVESGFSFWVYQTSELSFYFSNISLMIYLLSFLIVTMAWLAIKPLLNQYFDLKNEHKKLFKFKRNYAMFKKELLSQQETMYTQLPSDLIVGNPQAPLKLSIVTNPFCKYCKEAHFQLEELLEQYPEEISLNVLFLFDPEIASTTTSEELHYRLIDIYHYHGPQKFMEALGEWFKHKKFDKWIAKYGGLEGEKEAIKKIFLEQNISNTNNQVLFTPTITLGNYRFPLSYEKNDIQLFIQDLLEDQDILITTNDKLSYAH